MTEFDIYTGNLNYKGIEFTFVFNKEELRLIPPDSKSGEVEHWFMGKINEGVYTSGKPVYIEDDFLVGTSTETKQKFIFFPSHRNVGRNNSTLFVDVSAYIFQKCDQEWIDRLSFTSTEIDYIFPTTNAFDYPSWDDKGKVAVETKDFDSTTSKPQEFIVDDKSVKVSFGITRTTNARISKPPITLKSVMFFEFEKTKDYMFIFRLWSIAKEFVQYLCYRKNINKFSIDISAPTNEGKHLKFANMYILEDEDVLAEDDLLEKNKYICQNYIEGNEGTILSDIAKGTLYLRHLPPSYHSGRIIDASRFVMITAAFEWEFKRVYPGGVKRNTKKIEAESTAISHLEELIKENTGELKNIYKFLKKLVKTDSLQKEIQQVGKDFGEIIDVFGKRLYAINKESLKYNEMGKRLSQQRNNFAHGNLDKEFIGNSLLDLIYLAVGWLSDTEKLLRLL